MWYIHISKRLEEVIVPGPSGSLDPVSLVPSENLPGTSRDGKLLLETLKTVAFIAGKKIQQSKKFFIRFSIEIKL